MIVKMYIGGSWERLVATLYIRPNEMVSARALNVQLGSGSIFYDAFFYCYVRNVKKNCALFVRYVSLLLIICCFVAQIKKYVSIVTLTFWNFYSCTAMYKECENYFKIHYIHCRIKFDQSCSNVWLLIYVYVEIRKERKTK